MSPELADVNPDVAELYRRKLKRLAEELAQDPSMVIALLSMIARRSKALTSAMQRKRTFLRPARDAIKGAFFTSAPVCISEYS